jgi:hypothetical protein
MAFGFWALLFLISNIMGVQVFTAVFTLPREEALLPALVCIPLIAFCAFSAARLRDAWDSPDEDF